jgi:AcrR family transcriptional regulator
MLKQLKDKLKDRMQCRVDSCHGIRVPQQKRSEKTRQKILDAGLKCFEQQGFHNTSTKKIARQAGVSVGSFYSYFKDKKHLLTELVDQKISGIYELAGSMVENPELRKLPEKDLVRMMVVQARDMHIWSHEFNRELAILCYTDDDICRSMDEKTDRIIRMIVKILESRRDCLRVDDLLAAAHVVRGAIEFYIHQSVNFGAPIDDARLVDALVDMVHAYLFKPGPHGCEA